MDLPLKHPLTFGKKTINCLTFRDYTTANDYLAFDRRGGVAQEIALIANMTGQDEALIGQLRGPDYRVACSIVDKMIDEDAAAVPKPSEDNPEKKPQES